MIDTLLYQEKICIPTNLPISAQAWLLAQRIKSGIQAPTLWVVENQQIATQLTAELRAHLNTDQGIVHLPDWETLPYDRYQPHPHTTKNRLEAFYQISLPHFKCLITNSSTLLYRCVSPNWIKKNTWQIATNNISNRRSWTQQLDMIYDRVAVLSEEGQYCIRGSMIDIYPVGHFPCRLDFIDDHLDDITLLKKDDFSPIRKLKSLNLMPRFEANNANTDHNWVSKLSKNDPSVIKRLLEGSIIPGYQYFLPSYHHDLACILDHLPKHTHILIHDNAKAAMQQHWELMHSRYNLHRTTALFAPEDIALPPDTFTNKANPQTTQACIQNLNKSPTLADLATKRTILCSKNDSRQILLHDYLTRHQQQATIHTTPPSLSEINIGLHLVIHPLTESYTIPSWQLYWVRDEDLAQKNLPKIKDKKQKEKAYEPETIHYWDHFQTGQKVSHIDYGVGLLEGLVHLNEHAQVEAFVKISYANNKVVYLPIDNLNKISVYYGNSDLDELGHTRWANRIQRAKEACELYASHMLQQTAIRHHAVSPVIQANECYETFCKKFYFDITDDQLKATSEILHDIQQTKPMDRLLLGDVGFGKTEVMLRAAFVSIMSGYKVIVLCPTTILAEQHYQTAQERMSHWPIAIGLISRLKKSSERIKNVEAFNQGQIDLLFATGAILSHNIVSKNLGLIIVDEEHRFGVKDKQKLTDLHPQAHRLSISATPIPRTLQSALQNLRQMSFIQKPPKLRLPVKTILSEYNQTIIDEAIGREVSRGGQVFFIHNDISTHTNMLTTLQHLFPTLSIACIHGQMHEREITMLMQDFLSGKYQILISTTLIESGIDIPNANTIIVNRADMLGLAQLHQLRGRVGRSNQQAYAYLLYPENIPDGIAKQRLDALKEHSGLGAGWLLSIKDLEIRGAGSILGDEQSGHIDHIGYGLYQQLLNEAIDKSFSNQTADLQHIHIDIKTERYIPESYISDMNQRMNIYRKIQTMNDIPSLLELEKHLTSQYGMIPKMFSNIFHHHKLLILARKARLQSLLKYSDRLVWQWLDHTAIDSNKIFEWVKSQSFDIKFTNNMTFSIKAEDDPYTQCIDVLSLLMNI